MLHCIPNVIYHPHLTLLKRLSSPLVAFLTLFITFPFLLLKLLATSDLLDILSMVKIKISLQQRQSKCKSQFVALYFCNKNLNKNTIPFSHLNTETITGVILGLKKNTQSTSRQCFNPNDGAQLQLSAARYITSFFFIDSTPEKKKLHGT